jgi:glycogen debranching enzyme
MDLFPLRGKSIYVNALRYWATSELAETMGNHGDAEIDASALQLEAQLMREMMHTKLWYEPGKDLAILLQDSFSTSAYNEHGIDALGRTMLLPSSPQFSEDGYFLAYLTLRDYGDWFDTLGNIIAILSGVATDEQARQILSFIEKYDLAEPYPVSAMYPPLKEGDKDWRYYFAFGDLNQPHYYHNGGSWPMIGGLYVSALSKVGDMERAQTVLEKLIKANLNQKDNTWLFTEHRHGIDGQPHGMSDQAWSAGTLLYALHSMK